MKSGNNGIDILGTGFFFGTDKKEYLINDSPRPIHVAPFAAEYEAEKELRAYAVSIKRDQAAISTTDKEV